jgi:dienelactone hydrolase
MFQFFFGILCGFGFLFSIMMICKHFGYRISILKRWALFVDKNDWLPLRESNLKKSEKPSENADDKLLEFFSDPNWLQYRNQCITDKWEYNFADMNSYLRSVEPNRTRLKQFLGVDSDIEVNEPLVDKIDSFSVESIDCSMLKTVLKVGFGDLEFEAYVLEPKNKNKWSRYGIVALHGHDSSAENLIGLGQEDYGRNFALRMARKGFVVIIPNLTRNYEYINAISSHAFSYGFTLQGIELSFIFSCIKYLENSYRNLSSLGLYGISNGGFLSLLTAACSKKVEFVVCSGMLSNLYERCLSSRKANTETMEYLRYSNGPFWMEFDIAQLASLIAPRTLVFEIGRFDNTVRGRWERELIKIRNIYDSLALPSRLGICHHSGGHEIGEEHGIEALCAQLASMSEAGN